VFENGRYFTKGEVGLGKEAFFMLNLGYARPDAFLDAAAKEPK